MHHFHKKYIFKYFVLQFHVGLLGGHLMHQCGRYQEAVAGQLALSEAHVFHPQFSMPHVFLGAI